MSKPFVMEMTANISKDGLYRYKLGRVFNVPTDRPPKIMAFIMLNPSKADHTIDDPTITRCMGFARREGMDELQVVNLFAFRATDPDDLEEWYRKTSVVETMGDQNLWYVQDTVKHANIVVAAWGAHPMAHKVAHLIINAVEPLRRQKSPMVCFGTTKNGSPKHPLYLKNEQPLIKF